MFSFMLDTTLISTNSNLFHDEQMIYMYAFTKAKNNSFSSILSIYDNL